MRNIWTGALSFGLIHIPVKLYTATKSRGLDFNFLRKTDLCPIGFARVCKTTGEEVAYKDIVRGYEYTKGDYIVLQDEDLKKVAPAKKQVIEVTEFVNEKEIDPIYFEKPYYLGPDRGADKVYTLLLEALKRSGKIGIGKFVLRTKEHLVALKAQKNFLTLEEMRFKDEIIPPEEEIKPKEVDIPEQELHMAIQLIQHLSTSFKPEKYHDTYTDELKKIIEKKAKGGKIKPVETTAIRPTPVPHLMKTLKASLEAAKKNSKGRKSAVGKK
jgi:DNA end-binding protein Ku